MRATIQFNGYPVTLEAASVDELRDLLIGLTSSPADGGADERAADEAVVVPPPKRTGQPALADLASEPVELTEERIQNVLRGVQGQVAARFLSVIADSPDYIATDARIREQMPDLQTLAPPMSHIAKICKSEGLAVAQVLGKQERRGPNGKMLYRFRLNERVAQAIADKDDFLEAPQDSAMF